MKRLLASVCFVLAIASLAFTQSYTVTDLGTCTRPVDG